MLTKRQREILQWMFDHKDSEQGELVLSGGEAYWGDDGLQKTSPALVWSLVRLVAVKAENIGQDLAATYQVFIINESGERMLKNLPPYRDGSGRYHESLNF